MATPFDADSIIAHAKATRPHGFSHGRSRLSDTAPPIQYMPTPTYPPADGTPSAAAAAVSAGDAAAGTTDATSTAPPRRRAASSLARTPAQLPRAHLFSAQSLLETRIVNLTGERIHIALDTAKHRAGDRALADRDDPVDDESAAWLEASDDEDDDADADAADHPATDGHHEDAARGRRHRRRHRLIDHIDGKLSDPVPLTSGRADAMLRLYTQAAGLIPHAAAPMLTRYPPPRAGLQLTPPPVPRGADPRLPPPQPAGRAVPWPGADAGAPPVGYAVTDRPAVLVPAPAGWAVRPESAFLVVQPLDAVDPAVDAAVATDAASATASGERPSSASPSSVRGVAVPPVTEPRAAQSLTSTYARRAAEQLATAESLVAALRARDKVASQLAVVDRAQAVAACDAAHAQADLWRTSQATIVECLQAGIELYEAALKEQQRVAAQQAMAHVTMHRLGSSGAGGGGGARRSPVAGSRHPSYGSYGSRLVLGSEYGK
ncbi:hypothetical protein CXG81DRAFT_19003 [Caulochytrium protostelioides]|uniref:Uncharacterized protein n=1 Tax=Caulochytrium protostelioides TaxID=1555241 RepID=A0A4P9X7H5_9FUNG|nr:hypothetical protein CXG81DRAFT_19003 [Caulochytrium protostelioides]|eukprot:RKP01183.1 hypothetical protein CXG81DRAFT_19003 [Caulochytrium protostelioides]